MPVEMARGAMVGSMVERSSAKEPVHCQKCGSEKVYRVGREGYLQVKIYPLFGYYPWRCMRCGVHVILRKRKRAMKKNHTELS
jgi:DNA-directed RNA polymerase subunit RPC12/RpoP